jgi:hypothetical protein
MAKAASVVERVEAAIIAGLNGGAVAEKVLDYVAATVTWERERFKWFLLSSYTV